MTDAARIRALRTTLRLSQRELADEWGLSPGAIARWETGSNPVPGPVRKLLEIYEGELSDSGPVQERDSSFLARGFNGIVAYGTWVFFRRTFGVAGAASTTAHDAMARQFANHLANHRGVLVKLAQRAMYLEPLLSAEEREALAKLRDHVRPMSIATVHRLFRSTFGTDPRALLAHWDPRPARQGSIGQVYSATLDDGRRVAVKVQYPNSRDSISEDLEAAPLMDRWLTTMWPAQQAGVIFEEIRERFLEECDYAKEAEHIRRFRAIWSHDARVVIPGVIDNLSRGMILTTEWCEGTRWEDWLPTASPAARERFAELLWDFYWGTLITVGIMNADPHTGNFLFLPGATGLIDFGCVKVVTPSFHTFFQATARAVYEGRWLDVWRETTAMGLAVPTSEPDVIPRLWVWMLLPMLVGGPFRISSGFLRGLLDTFSLPIVRKTANMSRDTIFLHQVQLATYSMLAELDVAVDYRSRFVARLYSDHEPPPPLPASAFAPFGIDLDVSGAETCVRRKRDPA